jgi:regulator of protease activity HflC (stomatin/prohibitin superfamily)
MEFTVLHFLLGLTSSLIFITMACLCLSFFRVQEGHFAVLTRFGAVVYCENLQNKKDSESEVLTRSNLNKLDFVDHKKIKLYSPGIHFVWPWEKAYCYSKMERVLDLSGPEGGHAMTADGTILRLDAKIRFTPLENHLYSYMFELKNPMNHLKELFTCLIRNEIANFKNNKLDDDSREFIGSYDEIRRDRNHLNFLIEDFCQKQIGNIYGVQLNGVDLIDILPPPELEIALNGIQNAKTEAKTIYSKAEADSKQRLTAAEQGVQISKTKAQATAIEIQTIAGVLDMLLNQGSLSYYLQHRRTELMNDSRLTFVKKGEQLC